MKTASNNLQTDVEHGDFLNKQKLKALIGSSKLKYLTFR